MDRSRGWFPAALLAGALYVAIGWGVSTFRPSPLIFWRYAAWVASAVVYFVHIGYERSWNPRSAALHVATGVALAAFGLATFATVHVLETGRGNVMQGIALVAWPVFLGIPAFLVAWALATVQKALVRE